MSGAEIPAAAAIADAAIPAATTTALGTGVTAGAAGLGMAAPASFGTLGGLGASAVPGMAGTLGSGIAGLASTAPEVGSMFASSAIPSSFATPLTVGNALAKAGNAAASGSKVMGAMNAFQPQQPRMAAPQSRPIFQGEAPSLNPFSQQQPDQNNFARMLMQRRMSQMGLLG